MRDSIVKRMISASLTIILLGLLTGCAGLYPERLEVNKEHSNDENYITCMVWDRGDMPEGSTCDDNKLAEWIREEVKEACDVEVHFVSVPRSTSDDDILEMVNKGTAPDIVFTYAADVYGYMTRQGKASDLTDAYAEYGGSIKENIGDIQYMGVYNDRQGAIMKRRGFRMPRHVAYIRKDWCDALGMAIPTNKEELLEYLYAIKEQNPGNVKELVPWAMGGDTYSEKFYQSFVSSYIGNMSERDAYVYSEKYMVLADGAIEGLKKLNELYNDGIISIDFAIDSDNTEYNKTVREGRTGFVVEDATTPFGYISDIKAVDSNAEFDPLLCFDLPEGGYRNVTEQLYGMFIMVPVASKSKVNSVMKYLNWLADPQNAEMVYFTPEFTINEDGIPNDQSAEKYVYEGYPGTPADYCIVNEHFDYTDDTEAQINIWCSKYQWEDKEWFENLSDICNTDQYVFPASGEIPKAETTSHLDLEKKIVEYVYNVICCPKSEFDSVQAQEYNELLEAGIGAVLEERATYYDSGEFSKAQK